jgi:hypothetical protein
MLSNINGPAVAQLAARQAHGLQACCGIAVAGTPKLMGKVAHATASAVNQHTRCGRLFNTRFVCADEDAKLACGGFAWSVTLRRPASRACAATVFKAQGHTWWLTKHACWLQSAWLHAYDHSCGTIYCFFVACILHSIFFALLGQVARCMCVLSKTTHVIRMSHSLPEHGPESAQLAWGASWAPCVECAYT